MQHQPSHLRCRRIATAKNVNVPALSEMDVEAYAILPNLKQKPSQWATQTKMLDTGLIVAGTLLANRDLDLTIRVMNPTNRDIQLRKGVKCELDEVTVEGAASPNVTHLRCTSVNETSIDRAATVLAPLWSQTADDVPPEVRSELRELLLWHRSAFSLSERDLGYTEILQHEIPTGEELPVRQTLRRQPLSLLPAIDEQVEMMIKQGIVEPSTAEWSSNVVMVKKQDGSLRFCVDYRALNNKTRKDAFPLPLINECLDILGGASGSVPWI